MRRFLSRWAVTALGLALLIGGGAAMAEGWSIVQIERGWSLFIAGAGALSGGAVVIALGEVLSRLDEIFVVTKSRGRVEETSRRPLAGMMESRSLRARASVREAPPHEAPPYEEPMHEELLHEELLQQESVQGQPLQPEEEAPPPAPAPAPMAASESPLEPPKARENWPQPPETSAPESHEVDRYVSAAGVTYVTYSDGSVEVQTAEGVQRFGSLAELRAHAAQHI